MRRWLPSLIVSLAGVGAAQAVSAQIAIRPLKQREVPCQVQYAKAVETIGLARWSAPEAQRPSIERLLNAAAGAKELVDGTFLEWSAQLCSDETLTQLHVSTDRLEANGWLPSSPEDKRNAEAAAANDELLKAMRAGLK